MTYTHIHTRNGSLYWLVSNTSEMVAQALSSSAYTIGARSMLHTQHPNGWRIGHPYDALTAMLFLHITHTQHMTHPQQSKIAIKLPFESRERYPSLKRDQKTLHNYTRVKKLYITILGAKKLYITIQQVFGIWQKPREQRHHRETDIFRPHELRYPIGYSIMIVSSSD